MRRALPLPDELQQALGGCLIQAQVDESQRGFAKLNYRHGRGVAVVITELTSFAVHSLTLQQPSSTLSLGFWLHGVVTLKSPREPMLSQSGEGLLYCLKPGQCLELISQSPSAQWLHLSLHLQTLQHYTQSLGKTRPSLSGLLEGLKQDAGFLVRVMQRFLSVACTGDLALRPAQQQALEQVLCTHVAGALLNTSEREITSTEKRTDRPPSRAADYVELAINYLELNYQRPLNLQVISGACGVSARTLQAAFLQCVGYSPMQALQRIRLTHLYKLICLGRSVSESCDAVGLRMSGRLSALYQARFGELPRETLMRSRSSQG
jgi:AraC-like DNA-binding protein